MGIVLRNSFSAIFIFLLSSCLISQNKKRTSDVYKGFGTKTFYSNYEASIEFKLVNERLIYEYSIFKEVNFPTGSDDLSFGRSVTYSEYYNSNIKLKGKILTLKRNGKYRTETVKKFGKKTITSDGIFYEDQIQQSFGVDELKPGTITQLYFSCTGKDPLLSSRFLFNLEIPVARMMYKVVIPDYLKVRFVFVGDSANVDHKTYRENGKTIHTYETKGRDPIIFEDQAEDLTYYTPHLFVLPVAYTYNGQTFDLGGNTNNLFKYYNRHLNSMKDSDDQALFQLTDSLIANTTDTLERIKSIYNWVQRYIKYVAFEQGPNGFIPRPASKILANRYGDCKDKANLLITMLGRAKINAYYTWIGTRTKPYSYEQLPSPYADNHMIVSLRYSGNWYFLDATALALEYDYPSSFIQGKEALIRLSDTSFTVQKVPVVEANRSSRVDSLFLKIVEDEITGYGIQRTSGYFKEIYNNILLNSLNSEVSLKKEIDFGNNKLAVTDFNIKNENMNADLTFQYKFKLPNYLQTFNNDMYLNFNLMKDMNDRIVSVEKRKHDITNTFKYELIQHVKLDLPANRQVESVPKNRSFTADDFYFEINYEKKDNAIIYNKRIVINHVLLKKENFNKWNEMVDNLNNAYTEAIIIKSK